METYDVVLTIESLQKSYGETIQMKTLWQYFCMVLPISLAGFEKIKFGVFS